MNPEKRNIFLTNVCILVLAFSSSLWTAQRRLYGMAGFATSIHRGGKWCAWAPSIGDFMCYL